MTEAAVIFQYSRLLNLAGPYQPKQLNQDSTELWLKQISGMRALRVLTEIRPHLVGERLREAKRALEFFYPDGYHRGGRFTSADIWPQDEFPLRRRPVKDKRMPYT